MQEKAMSVSWFDTDGSLIDQGYTEKDYDPANKELPADTELWHYTGWTVSKSGNLIVCTATRVSKTRVEWYDHDGKLLKETYFTEEDEEPTFELPSNNEKWTYVNWSSKKSRNAITYTAERKPNASYFQGNVFQIVVWDQKGEPVGTGSGFVINRDGWFITNDHVMREGFSATAFFDIEDYSSGSRYTQLEVLGGAYNSEDKDIFIGKLENYQKIRDHYREIEFTTTYAVGETCYSVGYPNSSVKVAINQGTITEEYSDIHDKINGIYYVLSDCYIAPGSSGGILVNEKFEVIGITSIGLYADTDKDVYVSGGSIPTFVFQSRLASLSTSQLKTLSEIYDGGSL
ncbi:MAG: trypsin-like peptidase domain-containing protein [Oscillospiraceae bacterium]|nr:trypsin-like peptidase domain-containing protein [Oscillospiraceae bacterium]